ncbi:MAG: hypothetical protein JST22_06475 [Bacteroidetes bacterium]|nr:hypothetical protein [Bacteroidota bacterium]
MRITGHLSSILLAAAIGIGMAPLLQAQPTPPGAKQNTEEAKATAQFVDSRKGYVIRIPGEAILDSSQSGWSRKGRYEVRLYKLPGIGIVRITATVKTLTMPSDTVNSGAYIYSDHDSATERGNAIIRTYYLPTRRVRIELIPVSYRMMRYLEAAKDIFATFRWKPGANTEAIDTDPPAAASGK